MPGLELELTLGRNGGLDIVAWPPTTEKGALNVSTAGRSRSTTTGNSGLGAIGSTAIETGTTKSLDSKLTWFNDFTRPSCASYSRTRFFGVIFK